MNTSSKRIPPVDGLRALAVMGVIWAHVWALCGTPALSVGHLGRFSFDAQRLFSMFGTGVDLFFVISGFCMYLMYIRKQTEWSWGAYLTFMKRRWLRLAPAFYIAAFVFVMGLWVTGSPLNWRGLLVHAAFIQSFFGKPYGICPPFWSLATEWHFYMILPIILLAMLRWGFGRVLTVLILLCLLIRVAIYSHSQETVRFWSNQLPPRLIEFAWGILIAHWMVEKKSPPKFLLGNFGFVIGLLVVLGGRLLLTRDLSRVVGSWEPILLMAWEPLLSFGYALLIWNVVSSPSVFADILSHPASQAIGRWSYSLYLWHWWPAWFISTRLVARYGPTLFTQYLALGLLLLFIIPFCRQSYEWLEAPYFTRWRGKDVP